MNVISELRWYLHGLIVGFRETNANQSELQQVVIFAQVSRTTDQGSHHCTVCVI